MKKLLTVLVLALAFAFSVKAQTTLQFGETNVLTSADNGNANLWIAQNAVLTQSGPISSVSFYVATAAGNLVLGVCDATGPNGGPGKVIGQTASFVPVVGWNIVNLITPASATPGTYWLTYLPSSDSLAFVKGVTAGITSTWTSFTFGPLPATFPTTGLTTGTSHWSLYATLILSGPPPPPHTVSLAWTPSSGCVSIPAGTCTPVTQVSIYRGTTSGSESQLATVDVGSLPTCPTGTPAGSQCYTDSSVVNGTTYFYQVTSTNQGGESGKSGEVSATIPATGSQVPNAPTVSGAVN